MLHHVLFFRLRHDLSAGERQAAILRIKASLEALEGKIDGLYRIFVGKCTEHVPWDCVLYSEMRDAGVLATYRVHPLHLSAAEYLRSVTAESGACDYLS